jgi:hypothetical protein
VLPSLKESVSGWNEKKERRKKMFRAHELSLFFRGERRCKSVRERPFAFAFLWIRSPPIRGIENITYHSFLEELIPLHFMKPDRQVRLKLIT